MDSPTDRFRTSVVAARRGDRIAYDELFGRNLPMLVAYLRGHVSDHLARLEPIEDLAQSVCREVLRDLPGLDFRGEEQFRAYLFLQARRKVIDRHRYHKQEMRDPARQAAVSPDSAAPALLAAFATWATPSRVASGKEELADVEAALDELPEAQRDAVMLSRLAGLSYGEIAGLRDTTEAAVRALVARGLARLSGLTRKHRPAAER